MKWAMFGALVTLSGCVTIREVNSDGGRGGYMVRNDGFEDTWIVYCLPTQDINQARCKKVWSVKDNR